MTQTLLRWPALLCASLTLALAGCAAPRAPTSLRIDDSIRAVSQDSRVRYIVLHYTSANNEVSLRLLSQGNVSSHYLITDTPRPQVYRLVDESRTAWHAGESRWFKQVSVNPVSIGIELVNQGRTDLPQGQATWEPYSENQIQALILLLKDLIARHGVKPENIVGHSDIAPQRKTDPGPLFPWKRLAQAGIGRWYDEARAATYWVSLQQQGVPDIAWFQRQLELLGYACPQTGKLDRETKNVLAAFQMHYRPHDYQGKPDAETAAIMMALLEPRN
ncbi:MULTISPECIES: N-acetylmuramoyl-L-alanine amidase [unclassified Bordetella]|uniref:N-acetylmuramoyl-L-alanine amidase n=1 Tax=unclassified Bordetella TaxID=2630031 RepID=UPI00132A51F2|nr:MULTISPECIES: N-acetylmuramoyl-L-alanine amidase [unclassified Bordetella]MVW71911.1 N-acetylmuramoyl-L-alanine amidase [Bordetella sp. 15P40C-2]MVW77900.1 N-acetylmuramoyl-L-alanine amidase [Bordetella sp. 02P26C-1]